MWKFCENLKNYFAWFTWIFKFNITKNKNSIVFMMEPDIENNKKDKRKTLNIDLSVYETKVSAARLHYQGLLRQEI